MLKNVTGFSLVLVLGALTAAGLGCGAQVPPPSGGNGNDNGGGNTNGNENANSSGNANENDNGGGGDTARFTIVKTDIDVHNDAAIRAGDDLVAFGTGATAGVSYIIPSTDPTVGTAVPESDSYDSGAFAVGGDHIFLVGANTGNLAFQVSVFDAVTGSIVQTFPTTDIRLGTIPASEEDAGNIQADGDYCVVICDQNTVSDGKIIKVINAGTNPPTLISFDINPGSSHFQVDQVAIDAATRRAVVVADDTFFVYNIDSPNAPPAQVAAPNGVGDVQIEVAGDYILAVDNQAHGEAFFVDIPAESVVALTSPEAALEVAIGNDVFAFFADADLDDRSGGSQRAAVGVAPGPDTARPAVDQYIDGSTANNGLVGYGGSLSITPGGEYVFLSDGYLQYSDGDAGFSVPPDPDGSDLYGTPAWDVDCSANTVAFKTASDRTATASTKVGYIELP